LSARRGRTARRCFRRAKWPDACHLASNLANADEGQPSPLRTRRRSPPRARR
jgi:hypothetical protein